MLEEKKHTNIKLEVETYKILLAEIEKHISGFYTRGDTYERLYDVSLTIMEKIKEAETSRESVENN